MNKILISLARAGLRLLFPRAPKWLPVLLIQLVEAAMKSIEWARAKYDGEATGPVLLETALSKLGPDVEALSIPGWEDVSVGRKRRILSGLVELAIFIWDISADGKIDESAKPPSPGFVPTRPRQRAR